MTSQDVLLDACVVINLAASQIWDEIADANGYRFLVTRRVTEESQFCYKRSPTGLDRVEIDLRSLEKQGRLGIEDPNPDELSTFVEYAKHLDDGEAETLAVSVHRRLALATDDLGAIRFLTDGKLSVSLVRTSTMIHTWASAANPTQPFLTEVLRHILEGARFVPPRTAPFAEWWMRNLN